MTTYIVTGRDTGEPSLPDDSVVAGLNVGQTFTATLSGPVETELIGAGLIAHYPIVSSSVDAGSASDYQVPWAQNGRAVWKDPLTFDARDHGLLPSNTGAQNTTAAAALVSLLPSTGSTIDFGGNEYDFDCTSASPFSFPTTFSNGQYKIRGQGSGFGYAGGGSGTRLKRTAGANPIVTNTNGSFTRRIRIDLEHIEINGNSSTGDLVVLGSPEEHLWLDVRLQDAGGSLFHLTEAWNCRHIGCFFLGGGNGTTTAATILDGRTADAGQPSGGGSVVNHFVACEWERNLGIEMFIDGDGGGGSSNLTYFTNCKFERSGINPAAWPQMKLGAADRVIFNGGSMLIGGAVATLTGSATSGAATVTFGSAVPAGVTTTMTVSSPQFAYGTTITTISGDRLTLTMSNNALSTSATSPIIVNGSTGHLIETASTTGLVQISGSLLQHSGNADYYIEMGSGGATNRLNLSGVAMYPPLGNPPNFYTHLGASVPADGFQQNGIWYAGNTIAMVFDQRAVSLVASQFIEKLLIDDSTGSATRATVGNFRAWQMPDAATSNIFAVQSITDRFADNVGTYLLRIKFSSPSTGGNVRFQLRTMFPSSATDVTGAGTVQTLTQAAPATINRQGTAVFTISGLTVGVEAKYAISRLGADAADTLTDVINISAVELIGTPRR